MTFDIYNFRIESQSGLELYTLMISNLMHIAIGGALGSVLRYVTFRLVPLAGFPLGTLAVNASSSFLIGFVYIFLQHRMVDDSLRLFLVVGILGGFTTFSAFSLETLHLLQDGYSGKAFLNITLSIILCLLACYAGIGAAKSL